MRGRAYFKKRALRGKERGSLVARVPSPRTKGRMFIVVHSWGRLTKYYTERRERLVTVRKKATAEEEKTSIQGGRELSWWFGGKLWKGGMKVTGVRAKGEGF